MSELSDAVNKLGIQLTANHIMLVTPPKDNWAHDLWDVTLSYQGRQFNTEYRTGLGHRTIHAWAKKHAQSNDLIFLAKNQFSAVKTPNVADVVYSLLMDAHYADQTFSDWCENVGFDTDSRKALDVYLRCQDTYNQMVKLLGYDTFSQLVGLEH